ncbi:MAG TPA: CFI-box-CTERM domain-containing protein [Kofleriaceae bacterium]|nr:CFI-box-CTERM domain-containing protein [Kofleriaceae bacterium]
MARRCREALLVGVLVVCGADRADAAGNCTSVDVDFMPAANGNKFAPQIVAWVEDTTGNYVETVFITQSTGTFGIGNRPGRFDFNSGPGWPYGRRITVFPIWAHRHGLAWDQLVFQAPDTESNLSHEMAQSSREFHFCRPIKPEESYFDAMTCASEAFTDKGIFDASQKNLYPPRNDLTRSPAIDAASVAMFELLNPFDAVSQATPAPGAMAQFSWTTPPELPLGNYVMFVEVSREFDMNSSYNPTVFPPPAVPFDIYGLPYRGQPSVLYRIPFTIGSDATTATTSDYVGYSDPTGLDGDVRPPDSTISSDVMGSGALRLALIADGPSAFRIRVGARPQFDDIAPALPSDLQVVDATSTKATLAFVAPGDDGTTGRASRYEIRYLVGEDVTADNFDRAVLATASVLPTAAGTYQQFQITGLLPETAYSVGVRAFDDCRNASELSVLTFQTPDRVSGEVDACFVATAAYGSVMANDVELLRRFRDLMLRKTVAGELAIDGYYTFGPALAGAIGESDLLRATTRRVLAPWIDRVRSVRVDR